MHGSISFVKTLRMSQFTRQHTTVAAVYYYRHERKLLLFAHNNQCDSEQRLITSLHLIATQTPNRQIGWPIHSFNQAYNTRMTIIIVVHNVCMMHLNNNRSDNTTRHRWKISMRIRILPCNVRPCIIIIPPSKNKKTKKIKLKTSSHTQHSLIFHHDMPYCCMSLNETKYSKYLLVCTYYICSLL